MVRGIGGEIRVGYHVAAVLGSWTGDRRTEEDPFRVSAELKSASEFWMNNKEHSLVLFMGTDRWRWEGVAITSFTPGHVDVEAPGMPIKEG